MSCAWGAPTAEARWCPAKGTCRPTKSPPPYFQLLCSDPDTAPSVPTLTPRTRPIVSSNPTHPYEHQDPRPISIGILSPHLSASPTLAILFLLRCALSAIFTALLPMAASRSPLLGEGAARLALRPRLMPRDLLLWMRFLGWPSPSPMSTSPAAAGASDLQGEGEGGGGEGSVDWRGCTAQLHASGFGFCFGYILNQEPSTNCAPYHISARLLYDLPPPHHHHHHGQQRNGAGMQRFTAMFPKLFPHWGELREHGNIPCTATPLRYRV